MNNQFLEAPGHRLQKLTPAPPSEVDTKMKFSFLQLRFIAASHSTSAANDSIVDIKRNGDRYVWIFRAPVSSSDGKRLTDVMVVTREEVLQHLKMFFDIHQFDMDPYKSLQILPPGFPSVLIPFSDVYSAFNSIAALFNTVFNNWAERTTYDDALTYVDCDNANEVLVGRDADEDGDDDDEDYDDEDEDEDEDEEEEEDHEDHEDHDCEIRCVTDGTCCCDFGVQAAPQAQQLPASPVPRPRHELGTYYINGVKYVPETQQQQVDETDDDMPDLVPWPRPAAPANVPATPVRTPRERHVPHAPPRVHRTMTSNGERVHTYFS